jgi:arylsulfatase A-like enzyme
VVSHDFIGPKNGFDQGFEVYDAHEAQGHSHVSTVGVTDRALKLLRKLAEHERPFFLFVHYFDPHYEYRRHPQYGYAPESAGRLRGGENILKLREMGPSLAPEEVKFLESVYDEEIRFTDAGIGRLLAGLRQLGLEEDTLVVVTADHGEEFFGRGWLGHTRTLYEEVIHVPLVIRVPGSGGHGSAVGVPVSLVSLAPTILDYLGIDAPDAGFEGPSLRPLIDGSGNVDLPPVRSEVRFIVLGPDSPLAEKAAIKQAVIDGRYKLIKDLRAHTYELYDLERDPGERENLASSRPELLQKMQAELDRTGGAGAAEPTVDENVTLDPKEAARLRDLGYVDE